MIAMQAHAQDKANWLVIQGGGVGVATVWRGTDTVSFSCPGRWPVKQGNKDSLH